MCDAGSRRSAVQRPPSQQLGKPEVGPPRDALPPSGAYLGGNDACFGALRKRFFRLSTIQCHDARSRLRAHAWSLLSPMMYPPRGKACS
jgi:hypothetical protein